MTRKHAHPQARAAARTGDVTTNGTGAGRALPIAASPTRRAGSRSAGPASSLPVRAGAFVLVGALVLGGAAFLLRPVLATPGASAEVSQTVRIDMGGFSPARITARPNEPLRILLVNPDSAAHSDGGGWHQMAIPSLGVDVQVAPRGNAVVDIPGAAPGDYAFYCDICCGGKENPTMQGLVRVQAA